MGFQPAKEKNRQFSRARYFCSADLFFFPSRVGISHFRIGMVLFLSSLRQILNFTTSDPRQNGQSSPYTTSSLQKVHGMRNCRVSVFAETEKPSLLEHERLHPPLFAFWSRKKSRWVVLIVVRFKIDPFIEETGLLCLGSSSANQRFGLQLYLSCCTAVCSTYSHSSNTPHMDKPHAHDGACCCLCCWAPL